MPLTSENNQTRAAVVTADTALRGKCSWIRDLEVSSKIRSHEKELDGSHRIRKQNYFNHQCNDHDEQTKQYQPNNQVSNKIPINLFKNSKPQMTDSIGAISRKIHTLKDNNQSLKPSKDLIEFAQNIPYKHLSSNPFVMDKLRSSADSNKNVKGSSNIISKTLPS